MRELCIANSRQNSGCVLRGMFGSGVRSSVAEVGRVQRSTGVAVLGVLYTALVVAVVSLLLLLLLLLLFILLNNCETALALLPSTPLLPIVLLLLLLPPSTTIPSRSENKSEISFLDVLLSLIQIFFSIHGPWQ